MKIALQITTSTLGDMVIEEADEKTTTNVEDQKAIVVELLVRALSKVTAAYKISKDMLDMGDEEYEDAHSRKIEQDKQPRYSSAEQNRYDREVTEKESCCGGGCACDGKEDEGLEEDTEENSDDTMTLTDEEYAVIQQIAYLIRKGRTSV